MSLQDAGETNTTREARGKARRNCSYLRVMQIYERRDRILAARERRLMAQTETRVGDAAQSQ